MSIYYAVINCDTNILMMLELYRYTTFTNGNFMFYLMNKTTILLINSMLYLMNETTKKQIHFSEFISQHLEELMHCTDASILQYFTNA